MIKITDAATSKRRRVSQAAPRNCPIRAGLESSFERGNQDQSINRHPPDNQPFWADFAA